MAGTLDYVGIKRSLCQECDRASLLFQACSLLLEDTNKLLADDLAFLLGVDHTREACQETLVRIDHDEWNMQVTAEGSDDLLAFTGPQAAGIDKDAGKLITYGAMHEPRHHRRIHAARESTDNTVLAGTLADLRDRVLYHGTGSPGRFAAADALEEVANDLFPLRGMCDFGMKLQPPHALCGPHGGAGAPLSANQRPRTPSEDAPTATGANHTS